jgi:hypothetical protein
MVNFCGRYVKKYSGLAEPFFAMTMGEVTLAKWTDKGK